MRSFDNVKDIFDAMRCEPLVMSEYADDEAALLYELMTCTDDHLRQYRIDNGLIQDSQPGDSNDSKMYYYRVFYQDSKSSNYVAFGHYEDALSYAEGIAHNDDIPYIEIHIRESDGGSFDTIKELFIKGNDSGRIEGYNTSITDTRVF